MLSKDSAPSPDLCLQRRPILDACCCPSFIVGLAGSWLAIEGAVLTNRTIAQRLTSYMWLGCSRVLDDQQVYTVARRLYALKCGVEELNKFYETLTNPQVPAGFIHPRFCPQVTSFVDEAGTTVTFQYVRPLESDARCVTFVAKLSTQDAHVVVKFVGQYGRAAHDHMAKAGYAPKLIHFENLGRDYRDLSMVVMDLVQGVTLADAYALNAPLPAPVHADVTKALGVLNDGGYVHGDLRRQNIMLSKRREGDDNTGIRFIDFDWVGKEGEVRYPAHVSSVILNAAGAKEFEAVSREHQDRLFQVL